MAALHRPEAKSLFSYAEDRFCRPSTMRERIFMAAAHLALAHDFIYEQRERATLASVETFLRELGSSIYLTADSLDIHGDTGIAYTWIPPAQRDAYGTPQHALKIAIGVGERAELLTRAEMVDSTNLAALQHTGIPDLQLPPRLYDDLLNRRQSPPESIY